MKKYVYSGKVKLCECGIKVPTTDLYGNQLHTGDVVIIYTVDENDFICSMPDHLTVVVAEQCSNSTGNQILNPVELEDFYVMGIRNACWNKKTDWRVMKVKDWKDTVHGEHWKEYGFSFKEE